MSTNVLILLVQSSFGIAVFGVAFLRYLRPTMDRWTFNDAVLPLLLLQSFRFLGLTFMVDHQISEAIPQSAAQIIAFGDFSAAALAFITALAVLGRSPLVKPLAVVFTIVGLGDLAAIGPIAIGNAFFEEGIGAMWLTIGTFAPAIVISHLYILYRLVRPTPVTP